MTTCWPDTCLCVFDVEKKKLLKSCPIHNNYEQMVAHARSFNWKYGKVILTELQEAEITKLRIKEKLRISKLP